MVKEKGEIMAGYIMLALVFVIAALVLLVIRAAKNKPVFYDQKGQKITDPDVIDEKIREAKKYPIDARTSIIN